MRYFVKVMKQNDEIDQCYNTVHCRRFKYDHYRKDECMW